MQETWRTEQSENFTNGTGHLWIGSGGPSNKHGVGILVHRRCKEQIGKVKVIMVQRAIAVDFESQAG